MRARQPQYTLASFLEFTLACAAMLSSVAAVLQETGPNAAWVQTVTFIVSWIVLGLIYVRRRYVVAIVVHLVLPSLLIINAGLLMLAVFFEAVENPTIRGRLTEHAATMLQGVGVFCFGAGLVSFPFFLLAVLGVRSIRRRG